MIDQEFYTFLEYELTKALSNTTEATLKGFWCDGILPPTFDNVTLKKLEKRGKIPMICSLNSVTIQ